MERSQNATMEAVSESLMTVKGLDANCLPRVTLIPQALKCESDVAPKWCFARATPQLTGDRAGETFSVDSTITSYRMENGRRYHAYREGTYWVRLRQKSKCSTPF